MAGKELSEMSLEELWELFPVVLVEHDGQKWSAAYAGIEAILRKALEGFPVGRIAHVGSTAIGRIRSKDIVDVLVEIPAGADMEEAARAIERNGFLRMSSGEGRISFNRGYTKDGFADKVFHVHLRRSGDNGELYFRDWLNDHPALAREYEALKLDLQKKFEHDRDAYTAGKTPFVRKWTAEARKAYADRYGKTHPGSREGGKR